MKPYVHEENGKSGGVLVMAVLVVLVVSTLAIGMFRLNSNNAVETIYMNQSKQAFWAAETGLLDAVERLRFDDSFRATAQGGSASITETNVISRTGYDVLVEKTAEDALSGKYSFDITSTGRKGGMNRRIHLSLHSAPGILSPILAPNINIAQNTIVKGGPIGVLGPGGSIIIDDKIPPGQNLEGDYDAVVLGLNSSVDEKSSGATEGEHYGLVDLPLPDLPEMPDYSAYETTANSIGSTSAPPAIIHLGGSNNYFNIPTGITVDSITGSGAIINTGPVAVSPKSSIGDIDVVGNVEIISFGSVDIGQKNDFAGDTLVYAAGTIYFGDSSVMSSKSALLADGFGVVKSISGVGIMMGGHSQFEGIVYAANGTVEIQQGSNGSETRIVGTAMSGTAVNMGQNCEIIFDMDVINPAFLNPEDFFDGNVVVKTDSWIELAPE